MALPKEQAMQALSKILSIGPKPCPYCGSMNGFAFDPSGTDIIAHDGINVPRGYIDSIPAITGYCKNCGYIIHFSLKGLKII